MKQSQVSTSDGSLEAQLVDLYRGQRMLLSRLGTSDPLELIALVEGLQEQLLAIYAESDNAGDQLPVFRPGTGA